MDFKKIIKQFGPHLLSIVVIIGCCLITMGPQLQGKKISGGDVVSSTAWSKQTIDYKEATGEQPYWNPSMFSGMPWGLLTAGTKYNYARYFDQLFKLGFKPALGILVKFGLIFYLALVLLGVPWYISLLGSLSLVLNVNYIILLEVGHQSKVNVLSNFPLIISGLILLFRQKWVIGASAISVATAVAISNNHIQMLYYLLLCLVIFAASYMVFAIINKESKPLPKIIGAALIAAALGGLANFSLLSSAMSFSHDTMRGKPILEKAAALENQNSSSSEDGLAWKYAMRWSLDLMDVAGMVIPRFVGGSSMEEVSANSEAGKLLRGNGAKRGSDNTYQAPMYWGNMVNTAGPNYMGLVSMFLGILGFFAIPKYMRWGFGGAMLLTLLMSMGEHASWLNKTFFDYLPLFNKFRTPNSVMNLMPIFLAFVGCLGLYEFLKSEDKVAFLKPVLISGLTLIGFCVFFALMGTSLFSFESAGDARYPEQVKDVFIETRMALFTADAWRSALFGILILGLFYTYLKKNFISSRILIAVLAVLMIVDLVGVDKRHLDGDNWDSTRQYSSNFTERNVDKQIAQMEPNGRGYYRVLDIPNMQSAIGSYRHNTIGGYHAAKLQRYQDMLDYYINKGNEGAMNMLNAKYIVNGQDVQVNRNALGNAWFVKGIKQVNSANEEIDAVADINPAETAIINVNDFPNNNASPGSGLGAIKLVNYEPHRLKYQSNSQEAQFAVFSEVWYDQSKGMRAFIDGEEVDFVRVNYILRGLQIPAGEHEVMFEFKPVLQGIWISVISSVLILLLVGFALYSGFVGGGEAEDQLDRSET